ncbi:hypothetical protein HY496_01225 [Candidatus Woesearchaeota archaeon]|nr:hypothetical protein [Candidatus Woesearchaeota archaeon]
MINIFFSPHWFSGRDILIDIFSIIVLLTISFVTFRYYRLMKSHKKHLYFSIATILLALSFISKIVTNFTLYEQFYNTIFLGPLALTFRTVHYSDTLFLVGTLIYRFLTLLGFYLLFRIYSENKLWYTDVLIIYLLVIAMYFTSQAYYIFHLTALFLLLPLVWRYICNCRQTKDKAGKLIAWSFGTIAASQVAFILLSIDKIVYVLAEMIQFIGYVLLLSSFLLVRFYGKKKK